MAMYALDMLSIAVELALNDAVYEELAVKFLDHFVCLADATEKMWAAEGVEGWNEDGHKGFYFDVLHLPGRKTRRLTARSMVGLIPLFAVGTVEPEVLAKLPALSERLEWLAERRARRADSHEQRGANVACLRKPGAGGRRLLSVLDEERLGTILGVMLDEEEFLSPHGVRSLSRVHRDHPHKLTYEEEGYAAKYESEIRYEPAASQGSIYGGNSNWRGPVWFPVNYLLVEALRKFHSYYGDSETFECPAGSGRRMTLKEVAEELSRRLTGIFLPDACGRRPVNGGQDRFRRDEYWRDLLLFHEYFDGDDGTGLGASHQGWTCLAAKLLEERGRAAESAVVRRLVEEVPTAVGELQGV
jgi:hypothetical protein